MSSSNIANIIEFNSNKLSNKVNILVVADAKISNSIIHSHAKEHGHQLMMAVNCETMMLMAKNPRNNIEVILIDSEIEVNDLYANVKNIKLASKNNIPIIMMIDEHDTTSMQKGVEAGVFYYLTKPLQQPMLDSVLQAAIGDLRQEKLFSSGANIHQHAVNLVDSCRFSFKTLEQAESLAAFVANFFPNPNRALLGIGELLINAIEHGNLDIGYARKSELIAEGTWREEVEKRLSSPKYSYKTAIAVVIRRTDGVYITIEDAGDGFAWQDYMELNPNRSSDNHGRGIALANATSFDCLTYNKIGNKAIGFMANEVIFE